MSGPIIVLGLARGGTSAVTGVIQLGGADMTSGRPSPDGYYEDIAMRVAAGDHTLSNVVKKRNAEASGPWGWKDPTLLEQWNDEIEAAVGPDARFVLVLRDPAATANSIIARSRIAKDMADDVKTNTVKRSAKLIAWGRSRKCLTVKYEDLVSDPSTTITKLWTALGLSSDRLDDAVKFIQAGTYSNLASTGSDGA